MRPCAYIHLNWLLLEHHLYRNALHNAIRELIILCKQIEGPRSQCQYPGCINTSVTFYGMDFSTLKYSLHQNGQTSVWTIVNILIVISYTVNYDQNGAEQCIEHGYWTLIAPVKYFVAYLFPFLLDI